VSREHVSVQNPSEFSHGAENNWPSTAFNSRAAIAGTADASRAAFLRSRYRERAWLGGKPAHQKPVAWIVRRSASAAEYTTSRHEAEL
jgi:hypothetical protein